MIGQKLTSKYQTTIPKEIRDFLGLKAGDIVVFTTRGEDVVISRVKRLEDFAGTANRLPGTPDDYDEMRKLARKKALIKKGLIRD